MNRKTKTTATKEEARPALVPRLRFPEFREAEEWENKIIGPYLEDCSERVPADTELPIYSSTREGLKRQDAYFDGRVLQNKNEYGVVPPSCLVYRHMSDDGLFKFNINETGGDIAVSKEYPVFSTKGLNAVFLLAKLNDGLDFKQFALSQKAGGTRTRLYFSRLCEWRTLLPSLAEQQKIAECLSSVDELMAAQARKVDALKTHKKGLMQQLFPREGETQPRLRFPEFQNAREWEERKAGSLFVNRVTKGEQGLPIYSVTMHDGMVKRDTFDRNFYDIEDAAGNKKVCKEDIAYNMMRMWQGALGVAPEDCLVSPAYIVLEPMKDAVPFFFQYMFKLPSTLLLLTSHSRGLTKDRLRLYYDDFARIPLRCPTPHEQQRIASCLSSLDALIAAEAQKLEALKTHKKGLMQQLFPSPEGVEA